MTLLGAEQVQSASRQMKDASEEMLRASNEIAESLRQQRQFMTEWLAELTDLLVNIVQRG